MKIIIPGGSGQVGTLLARAWVKQGHDVVSFSRSAKGNQPKLGRSVIWDGNTLGAWTAELEGADVVVNLAGRSVNCRYTPKNRREIIESRVNAAHAIGRGVAAAKSPPRVWLQASTATIYSHRFDAPNDETNGIMGGGEANAPDTWRFSIEVAQRWEAAALAHAAECSKTRLVLLRSAMVMSPDRHGIFDTLLTLVRRGLGGTSGSGRQYVSWIHETDFVNALQWLIAHQELSGVVNLASRQPLPNAEFMRILRSAWGTGLGLPAAEWMLAIGAFLMRTETELILKSRRVIPSRLLAAGFAFEFPGWAAAARELCGHWRAMNHR